MIEIKELPITRENVPLRYAKGHFATNHSHINYYIDITYQKTNLREAKSIARQLMQSLRYTQVDTILCLDGMAAVGACLASELTKTGLRNVNESRDIYILEPELHGSSQIVFRDNIKPMIRGKHILVLMASMTTGFTAKSSIEAISYYGGYVAGVAALYSAVTEAGGYPVASIYTLGDLPGYESYDSRDCPFCKRGQKLDALVNSYGYSEL